MLLYLGWIIAAFLGGLLLAICRIRKQHGLPERFAKVEYYQGRSFHEILAIVHVSPCVIIYKENKTALKTWREQNYSITLAFDEQDICLGVYDEQYPPVKNGG